MCASGGWVDADSAKYCARNDDDTCTRTVRGTGRGLSHHNVMKMRGQGADSEGGGETRAYAEKSYSIRLGVWFNISQMI